MEKRIITRPDFDGVVCAVLLKEALGDDLPVLWVQPNKIQQGRIPVTGQDIIANLPMHGECALWFDHHVSNETQCGYRGLYRIAPSAAGLIYEYFQEQIDSRFEELVRQADKIDAAQLEMDEIQHPERYPYIVLSMSIPAEPDAGRTYCDRLVQLLRDVAIEKVLADPEVAGRCRQVIAENRAYEQHLKRHTRVEAEVSITDFRDVHPAPNGNRFLVYSLFPETVVNLKLFNENGITVVKVGHSIINRNCRVNVGRLLAAYGGGGHRGAGACRLDHRSADGALAEILAVLIANRGDEPT